MKFEDKATFYDKLSRAATAVGRKIGREETDVFFDELKEFPIDVVLRAIDKALRARDPEDKYIITKLLTTTEIRAAVAKVLAAPGSKRSGCDKCQGTTWILPEPLPAAVRKKLKVPYSEPAKRCECWHGAIESKKMNQEKKEKS
jgi:hypothetical protein